MRRRRKKVAAIDLQLAKRTAGRTATSGYPRSYRLDEKTLRRIDYLMGALEERLAKKVTKVDVLRRAVRLLERRELAKKALKGVE